MFYQTVKAVVRGCYVKLLKAQVFSCEFWEIFKNTYFTEHPRTTVLDCLSLFDHFEVKHFKTGGLKGLALKGLKFKNEFRTLKNIQISFYIQLPTGQSCDICYTREKNKATAKNSVSGSPNVPGSHMQTRKYKLYNVCLNLCNLFYESPCFISLFTTMNCGWIRSTAAFQ